MTKLWINIIDKLKGKKYVAGVSGGPDSMAMLDMYKKKIKVVCHIDYGKRESSKRDKEIVINFCQKNNIICEVLTVTDEIYNLYDDVNNFQKKARMIRYDFFKQIADKYNLNHLMLAHHLDDHLETAYMLQSKESKALFYGIKKKTIINNLNVYRPLIDLRKTTLIRYCNEHHISYGFDETNDSTIYERNAVRKMMADWSEERIFQFIKKINEYNKQNRWLDVNVQLGWTEFMNKDFDFDYFFIQTDSIQYYLMFYLLNHWKIKNVSEDKINGILNFLSKKNQATRKYRVQDNTFITVNENKKIALYIKDNEEKELIID
ncbi:tRNA lysidine(34) synthetase TilS [Ureaplasma canigenitalium]|uniref:tRNA lysidine(34) synthetase TilS n=1 Tax=Ureaplasma canigenitalium TaxID=42092 RepID=UPI0004E28188|nr:tRNA lysidine(34) synthetase TilS [Ureaplasma canigenitalium]